MDREECCGLLQFVLIGTPFCARISNRFERPLDPSPAGQR